MLVIPQRANLQVLKYYLSTRRKPTDRSGPFAVGRAVEAAAAPEGNSQRPTSSSDGSRDRAEGRFLIDVGIAAQTILLGAAEMGLGAV